MIQKVLTPNQCMFLLGQIHGFFSTVNKIERYRLAEVSRHLEDGLLNYPPEEVQLILLSEVFTIETKLNGMKNLPINHVEMLEKFAK